jgi:hypothetical protein
LSGGTAGSGGSTKIAKEYRKHFIEEIEIVTNGIDISNGQRVNVRAQGFRSRVRAGFAKKDRSGWKIHECGIARVEQSLR